MCRSSGRSLFALMAAGEGVAAWCFDEPGVPWGPDGVALEATPTGDGGYELTGTKLPVDAAAQA